MKNLKKFLLSCLAFGLAFTCVVAPSTTYTNAATVAEDGNGKVTSFADFVSALKLVEEYAAEYAGSHAGEDKTELVINYVRTGVERYRDGSWAILAGEQNDEFVNFVKAQDEANGTNASDIRNLVDFKIPNSEDVDFGHMFGTMNITYYMAKTNPTAAGIYADLGGWAGDLTDLMEGTVKRVNKTTDVEAMVKDLADNYFGVVKTPTTDYGFDIVDIRGDLDAYYIMQNIASTKTISVTMENYYNKYLTPESRARFFVANRFGNIATKEALREAVYEAYANNTMIRETLEGSKGLTTANWPAEHLDTLRHAVCYVFADYLWNLTGPVTEYETNDVYSVFDVEESTLAPGVTQQIKYAYAADGKQLAYYIATSDVTRDDVHVFANYKDNDPSLGWGMARVMDQMIAAIKNHTNPNSDRYIENYNPVVGTNGDFYNMTTGQVSGALVMEGVKYSTANGQNFFAILNDGTPVLGSGSDWAKYESQVKEAIGGSVWLVKDGKIVAGQGGDRASRTCVGITADNKVVMMVLDGRQEPFSAGGSMAELAQIMLDAGCVNAINLDGGGSTTFIAKPEGEDELKVINSPSDGFDRSVSSSLMVVSTSKPSNEFSHALVTSDADYLTVGTTVNVDMMGVSVSGGNAQLPEGAKLQLSNTTVGTLSNGVFTATANGTVDVQVVVNGTVVGKKTLRVVNPDSMIFEKETMNLIYGVPTELPVKATYNGNVVKINANDVVFKLSNEKAGTLEGFTFTGVESSKVRTVYVRAILKANLEANTDKDGNITYEDKIQLDLYKTGEAAFDFENATAGDRHLAYNRVLSNTTTKDGNYYYVVDPSKAIDGSYTFGIDMKMIEMPEVLKDLVQYLPGGDKEDATAWDFLLQLAERINPLTVVEVTFNIDPNFEANIDELTLVNEYFRLNSKEYNKETNTVTIKFNWIDQTAAIDAATANSICILSGLKFTPKAGTAGELNATFTGKVTYDVYLRANAVYSLANDKAFQEQYGIYPYIDPTNPNDKGGHFASTLATVEDSFTLNREGKEGWFKESDGHLYFYENSKPVTGIQKVDAYLQEGKELFYEFDEKGACVNENGISGKFTYNNAIYFAAKGELKTGWQTVKENDVTNYYYFGADGKAVNGTQTIDGYTYTFEDYILVRGHLVTDANGTKYIWAGSVMTETWVEIDGRLTYIQRGGYFHTGMQKVYDADGVYQTVFFGEDGFVVEVTGLYEYEGQIYLVEDGFMVPYAGLVYIDGYYYYFNSSNTAVRNTKYYISKPNGLLPAKQYQFDENGRMVVEGQDIPKPEQPEEDDKDENTNVSILRIFGQNRYETAYNVADTLKANLGVEKFDTIIITTGLEYADALAGSYLAGKMNAPIIMTHETRLDETAAYVKKNVVEGGKVYILGGEKAVSAEMETKLSGFDVKRLAGANRFETNLAILEEAGVTTESILVCTGYDFADSLSASATGLPILLVHKTSGLNAKQIEFLESVKGNNMYIIGGKVAVNETVENVIKTYGTTKRIGGATRNETSVLIAKEFFNEVDSVVVAYSRNFPDGLAGGPLAMSMDAPLILCQPGAESVAAAYTKENNVESGIVLGGSILLSDASVKEILNASADTTVIVK